MADSLLLESGDRYQTEDGAGGYAIDGTPTGATITGVVTATGPAPTAAALGTATVVGTAVAVGPQPTAVVAGQVGSNIVAVLTAIGPVPISQAVGQVGLVGTLVATGPSPSVVASGQVITPTPTITGTVIALAPAPVVTATGLVTVPNSAGTLVAVGPRPLVNISATATGTPIGGGSGGELILTVNPAPRVWTVTATSDNKTDTGFTYWVGSREHLVLDVKRGTVSYPAYQTAVLPYGNTYAESDWVDAVTFDGHTGVWLENAVAGVYRVLVRVLTPDERAVVTAALINVRNR